MNITNATVVYFTGTNTTKRYAEAFAKALPFETSLHMLRYDKPIKKTFDANELLVLAGPVFGGYMPPFVWEQLETIKGNNTPAVLLAVYGARDYDNALLEMNTNLSAKGFVAIGAAALVARHSIATFIAPDRPNEQDLNEISAFAHTIAERLEKMQSMEDAPTFAFKGVLDGKRPHNPAPEVSDECTECGICAMECPIGAIPEDAPNTTDGEKCIACLRCVEMCPFEARHTPEAVLEKAKGFLSKTANPEKPNEFF